MEKTFYLFLFAIVASGFSQAQQQVNICYDPDNILASGIFGEWDINNELTDRLRPTGKEEGDYPKIIFRQNDSDHVKWVFRKLADEQICAYAIGSVTVTLTTGKELETYFAVINHRGNPAIVFSEDKDGQKLDAGYAMFAKSEQPQGDILFMGGDHNNQGLTAFNRATL